jgi:Tol biopolymer transport system component
MKDPEDRWQAAADVARELRWVADESAHRLSSGGPAAADARSPASRRRRVSLYGAAAAAVTIAATAAGIWLWWRNAGQSLPPMRLVHLTTSPGIHDFPALSPDGKLVAFMWDGADGKNRDIYVKLVGEADALRLTSDPAIDRAPCWSPDGKRIAFQRRGPDGTWGIFTMSPLGGEERRVTALPDVVSGMSWSADGRWLAVSRGHPPGAGSDTPAGIYSFPVAAGEPVRITQPRSPTTDQAPRFSPDGSSLAFARTTMNTSSDLFIQPLNVDGAPAGEPRRLTHAGMLISGLSWHRDGRSIIMAAQPAFLLSYLYRLSVDGSAPLERIELSGPSAHRPSISSGSDRLAFAHRRGDWDIWRLRPGGTPEPFVRSSLGEWSPHFSPDGQRIAFTSNRNGETSEIWSADADGANAVQLTHGPGRNQGSARWSVDGRWLAFDSTAPDGTMDIYVIESGGGPPRRVTTEPSNEYEPTWSHNGKWIYFRSDRTGRGEIWRTPFAGGPWEQMTRAGADAACESSDGKMLFHSKFGGELRLKRLDGGPDQRLVEYVHASFAVVGYRVYYWGRPGADRTIPLSVLDLSTNRSTELARISPVSPGLILTVSPDERTILYTGTSSPAWEIMMLEDFR